MELIAPKPKKPNRLRTDLPLPLVIRKDGTIKKISCTFNGFTVLVDDPEDMKTVVSMGCFGKGNLSRSFPHLDSDKTELIRNRQYNHRKKFNSTTAKKVVVLPDSDDEEIECYITNLKPEYQIDRSCVSETVCLGLEEAFFLAYILDCLIIKCENEVMNADQMWKEFCNINPNFAVHYTVYYHFRAKNWVVKPGIKYGGDFLLYKQGPSFYHASYVVMIEVTNHQPGGSDQNYKLQSMDNSSVMGLNRLCQTAAKELLFCRVTLPDDCIINYKNLPNVLIEELLVRRWIYSRENS